jgi:hypothetical protein
MMRAMAKFRDRAAALRETTARGSGEDAGAPLRLVETGAGGFVHELAGAVVGDGEMLELLLETGWVAGHYRATLHSESGRPAFEVHVAASSGAAIEHIRIHLPHEAILRRVIDSVAGLSPAALRAASDAFGGNAQPGGGDVTLPTTAPDSYPSARALRW